MANSYITIAEADEILAAAWNIKDWDTTPETTKQAALDHSVKMIERCLKVALADVPEAEVKEAIALQAAFINEHAGTIKRAAKDGIDRAVSQDFGGISMQRETGRFSPKQMVNPEVMAFLSDYIPTGAVMERV